MGKKRFKGLTIFAIFMLFAHLCYAQVKLEEPPADGIYSRDDITIKFIPPTGWKIFENSFQEEYGMIVFMPFPFEVVSLGISVYPTHPSLVVEPPDMLELAKKDENVVEAEVITFADTKALSTLSALDGIKTRQIEFNKGRNTIIITFVADEQDFDKFLPFVNESLKSFKVVSKDKEYQSTDLSLYPSKKLFKKFQAIADKMCSELIVGIKQQSPEEYRQMLIEQYGLEKADEMISQEQEVAKGMGFQLMEMFKGAFIVSDSEAKRILTGEYDDAKNKKDIRNYISEFAKLEVALPLAVQYLIDKYYKHSLSSLELEFTARLFKEYLEKVKGLTRPKVKEQFK